MWVWSKGAREGSLGGLQLREERRRQLPVKRQYSCRVEEGKQDQDRRLA